MASGSTKAILAAMFANFGIAIAKFVAYVFTSSSSMLAEAIRESGAYQVLTPDGVLELARGLGDHSVLYLNPLLSGIDPAAAWDMLQLFEREVWPCLRERRPPDA